MPPKTKSQSKKKGFNKNQEINHNEKQDDMAELDAQLQQNKEQLTFSEQIKEDKNQINLETQIIPLVEQDKQNQTLNNEQLRRLQHEHDDEIYELEKEQIQQQEQIHIKIEEVVQNVDPIEFADLIYPWSVNYDENWKQYYYFNFETGESSWEISQELELQIQKYYEEKKEIKNILAVNENIQNYIPQTKLDLNMLASQDFNPFMKRPARKQVEKSLAEQFAYKQGDEEYNIWYDKYLTDSNVKEREMAPTKCDPEIDSGYTKADLYETKSSYFCIHFARGCCCEGANCRYYHRVPNLEECNTIEQSRDIFGRQRHQTYRDDMGGVGAFSKECRSLYISDFRLPQGGIDPKAQAYESLWRHFSVWGHIEDINLIQGKGLCFIRYKHRCMAEYSKEAMMNRSLDANEIITIKWANEDPDPKVEQRQEIEDNTKMKDAILKKQRLSEEQYQFVQRQEEERERREEENFKLIQRVNEEQRIIDESRIEQGGEEDEESAANENDIQNILSMNF